MSKPNIVSEYFDTQENLNVRKSIDAIQNAPMPASDICIRFYGLNEYDFWLNAEDIIEAGGLKDYLISILDEPTTEAILSRDYEVVDYEGGEIISHYYDCGGIDWKAYEEALECFNNSNMEKDAFCAGLDLDIPPEKVEDAYQGEFEDDEVYAREYLRETLSIPDHLENYIDWDAVARDAMCDFNSYNNFYFTNHW